VSINSSRDFNVHTPTTDYELSDHRPVTLTITDKPTNAANQKLLKAWAYHHSQWRSLTQKAYHTNIKSNSSNPYDKLDALHEAFFKTPKVIRHNNLYEAASSVHDKLDVSHAFVKHIENNRDSPLSIEFLLKQNPELHNIVRTVIREDDSVSYDIDQPALETYLQELHKTSTDDRMSQLDSISKDDEERDALNMQLVQQLSLKKPSNSKSLDIVYHNNTFHRTAKDISEAVHPHMSNMFSPSNKNPSEINNFLQHFPKKFSNDISWNITKEMVEEVLLKPNNSSPGPMGIPFKAYQLSIGISSEIIYLIILDMMSPQPYPVPNHLHDCFMYIIPKKSDCLTPTMEEAYSPGRVRPIIVSPSIMRIISQTTKMTLNQHAADFYTS